MVNNPYMQYKQTSILTASSENLTLMLYDECLKQIRIAKKYIEEKDIEKKNSALQKAQDIITELMSTLDMSYEISFNLMRLYEFVCRLLVHANIHNTTKELDDALDLITELREAWAEAIIIHRRDSN
ncbi:MAG: flagellar export chaperone FliS [Clostridia bacterium]|jgi:flagellar protein FliS|nr:flagellar export chaperone FliS [Clostridiaceae bacterium]